MFTEKEILEEISKIQYLYRLKREIRYGEQRSDTTESVAEHIFGMHICAQYFLSLENQDNSWDKSKIYEMITLHDIDEIETGDIIGYLKTTTQIAQEIEATQHVIHRAPFSMQQHMEELLHEYELQQSIEAQFVKALDKIEVQFQIYNDNGKKVLLNKKTTAEQHRSIKDKYVASFPYIRAFNEVISRAMQKEGFFS